MKVIKKTLYGLLIVISMGLLFVVLGNSVAVFGYQTMIVSSGSMEPSIKTGSIVVIKEFPSYEVSQVITYYERGREQLPTTHRIISIESDDGGVGSYRTKGDANNDPDQSIVRQSQIKGRVILDVPWLGYLLAYSNTWYGLIILVGIPFAAVVFDEIRKVINSIKNNTS